MPFGDPCRRAVRRADCRDFHFPDADIARRGHGRLQSVRHSRRGLPDDWTAIVEAHVALWNVLDAHEREVLEATSDWLLRHKHWEASHGFVLSDDITVTVAALAAMLALGLSVREYREVSAIIMYPTAMQSRGVYAGPVPGTIVDGVLPVLGEAHGSRGPVLLAWDQARDAAQHPGRGHNVVFHEFAHKMDMLDSVTDGTPPLEHRHDIARWDSRVQRGIRRAPRRNRTSTTSTVRCHEPGRVLRGRNRSVLRRTGHIRATRTGPL